MYVGATAVGGGALALDHSFADPIDLAENARVGGFVRYTAHDPAFEPPVHARDDFFFLADGVTVTVEVTVLDPGVAMKLAGVELDQVGASVVLGNLSDPAPTPRVAADPPRGGERLSDDRLPPDDRLADVRGVRGYTAYLTNDETTCEIPTAPACGDADGNGASPSATA